MIFLKTPSFWYHPSSWLSRALLPLSWLYRGIHWFNQRKAPHPFKASIPVICVGNVTMGGSGKTPVVQTLIQFFLSHHINVHILSRGYGSVLTQRTTRVDHTYHTASMVGDEPWWLAQFTPVWIGKNRVESAKAAIQAGAQLLIMDDGFQNPSLYKDFSLLVCDAASPVGNGYLFPAGPLREPLQQALARADAIIRIGSVFPEDSLLPKSLPCLLAKIIPEPTSLTLIQQRSLIAFAGIGRPEKFFSTLKEYGGNLIASYAFPDHYPYEEKDILPLIAQAKHSQSLLITTSKDWVRLPSHYQKEIAQFPITASLSQAELLTLLAPLLMGISEKNIG